jgi:putative DNA primase/helicase
MVMDFLKQLGLNAKQQGKNIMLCCLACDDDGYHLQLLAETGHGRCLKCDWRANLYKIAQTVTHMQPREIFEFLEKHGFKDSSEFKKEHKKAAPEITKEDIRPLFDLERISICYHKQLDFNALAKFKPFAHVKQPWMLLPAFDPSDMNRACGWMRVRIDGQPVYDFTDKDTGERKVIKYPIVSGSNHGLFGLRAITEDRPDTIIFAEAWRDALAAISLGYAATASSGGASTWTDAWRPVFEGRTVYICMDADKAGQRAAWRAAEALYKKARVYIVELPYEVKDSHGEDLHDYIMRDGHTREDMAVLLERAHLCIDSDFENTVDDSIGEAGGTHTAPGVIVLGDDHPDTIAEAFEKWSRQECGVEHRYNAVDGWSIYYKDKYQLVEDEAEIEKYIREFIATKIKVKAKIKQEDGSFKTYNAAPDKKLKTRGNINNIMTWLRDMAGVHLRPGQKAPCSLKGEYDPKAIIALNNCVIDISQNPPARLALSPDLYTFNYLPFDYDPEAKCPQWIRFLEGIFTTKTLGEGTQYNAETDDFDHKYIETADKLAIEILQEWFGYFITPQTHLQKIFCIIGEPRSGKGTTARVATKIMGLQNIATPTLSSLSGEFGLQGLLNKTLAIIGDAHLGNKNSNAANAVEILKGISGEDTQQVNRKNKTQIMVRLPVRFLMLANKIQDLRDSSGALASRFNFLLTTNSFLGREDTSLESKLMAELPGIFNWAIAGYYRLQARGHLLEHPAGAEARVNFDELSSPIRAFINECCIVGADQFVPVEIIWKAHSNWSRSNGNMPYSRQKFVVEIMSGCAGLSKRRMRVPSDKWDEFGFNKVGTKVGTESDKSSLEYCLFGVNMHPEHKDLWKKDGTLGTVGTRLEQDKDNYHKGLW